MSQRVGGLPYEGRSPSFTVAVFVFPSRVYVSLTVSPGCFASIALPSAVGTVTDRPSMAVTTSPAWSPASAAGVPERTSVSRTPPEPFAIPTPR